MPLASRGGCVVVDLPLTLFFFVGKGYPRFPPIYLYYKKEKLWNERLAVYEIFLYRQTNIQLINLVYCTMYIGIIVDIKNQIKINKLCRRSLMWRSRLTVWLSRQPATRTFASATLDGVHSGRLYLDVKIYDINEDF